MAESVRDASQSLGLEIPELGPSLGRLVVPAVIEGSGAPIAPWIPLDGIRLDLVDALFALTGTARHYAARGEIDRALDTLNGPALREAWERAVAGATDRAAGEINAQLHAAARDSRMPRRLLSGLLLSPPESRMLAGRLGRGAAPLLAALDELDMAIAPMHGPAAADPATAEGWRRALTLAARRLEAAWIALDEAMVAERGTWQREADWVRRWRRPQWPLWAITGLVLAIAGYLGLVFGGYLPAPAWLQGAMDTWWSAVGS